MSDYLLELAYKYMEEHPEVTLEDAMKHFTEKEGDQNE